MRLQFVKTLWGVTEQMGNAPGGYARLFKRIAAEGFQGVETPIRMVEDVKEFGAALREAGLAYVAMINTCTFAPDDTSSRSLDAHVESFRAQVAEAAALQPVLINAHSGCDSWSREVAEAYFSAVLAIEAAQAIPIVHETHRGRVLYNPWATRDLCRAFPALKLTADLSHFCVVGERVFSAADEDWQTCLAVIARATRHIHARVGYAQGPQVPDPAAPEYADALAAHESWWDAILTAQAAAGVEVMTIEPEHGVDGYQQRLPYTRVEVADVWAVNEWMRARQAKRMAAQPYCA